MVGVLKHWKYSAVFPQTKFSSLEMGVRLFELLFLEESSLIKAPKKEGIPPLPILFYLGGIFGKSAQFDFHCGVPCACATSAVLL